MWECGLLQPHGSTENQEISSEQSPKLVRVLKGHGEAAGAQQSAEVVGGFAVVLDEEVNRDLAWIAKIIFSQDRDTEVDRQNGQTCRVFVWTTCLALENSNKPQVHRPTTRSYLSVPGYEIPQAPCRDREAWLVLSYTGPN